MTPLPLGPGQPPKDKYLLKAQEGNGNLVVFSDSLARLTYVDSGNRIAQPSAAERDGLLELRKIVQDFTPTSMDAPPRVAIFTLGARVAVVNFTELPVACRIVGLGGMVSRLRKAFAIVRSIVGFRRRHTALAPSCADRG